MLWVFTGGVGGVGEYSVRAVSELFQVIVVQSVACSGWRDQAL